MKIPRIIIALIALYLARSLEVFFGLFGTLIVVGIIAYLLYGLFQD